MNGLTGFPATRPAAQAGNDSATTTEASGSRIGAIQSLRAVAAWLVVLHHVHQVFFDFAVASFPGWIAAAKGSVGVELFFVISGFVMVVSTHGKPMTAGGFLLRRFARIAPAYWLATAVFAVVLLAFPALIRDPFRLDREHVLLSVLFLSSFSSEHFFPVLTVGWSLNFEMFFYLLLACGIALARRTGSSRWERVVVAVAILGFVFAYPWRLPGVALLKSKMMLTFLMGYALGYCHLANCLPRRRLLGLLLIGVGIGVILTEERSAFVLRGLACSGILWGCLCFEKGFASSVALSRLGDWSYSTYLVHLIVLILAHQASERFGSDWQVAWIAGALVLTLVLSYVSHRYVELPTASLITRRRAHASR